MKRTLISTLITASFLTFPALAAEEGAKDPLKVTAELGILLTSGNTESSSLFGNITVNHDLETWKNKYTLDVLTKESEITNADGKKEMVKTDDKYTLTGKGSYKFTETSAAFIFGSYTNDDFGSYAEYTTVAAGYNFRAINKENLYLDLSVGPGYSEAKAQDGTKDDGVTVQGALALEWQINASTKFVENISVESSDFNTRTITETGVSAALNSSMQMKFSYKTTTDTDVAPGLEKTDTATSVTVVVNF